jgi:hypothetical protein
MKQIASSNRQRVEPLANSDKLVFDPIPKPKDYSTVRRMR